MRCRCQLRYGRAHVLYNKLFFLPAYRPHLVSHRILLPVSCCGQKTKWEGLSNAHTCRWAAEALHRKVKPAVKQNSSVSLSDISMYFLRRLERKTVGSVMLAQVLQHKDCGEITEDAQKTIALVLILFTFFIRCERKRVTAEVWEGFRGQIKSKKQLWIFRGGFMKPGWQLS